MVLTGVHSHGRVSTSNGDVPTIDILGIPVVAIDKSRALDVAVQLLDGHVGSSLVFVNAHSLNLANHDLAYREALMSADIVLNDGAGISLAARLQGRKFPDNLNGTDLTPAILRLAAARGRSVFLFGAHPGVAEEAARRLTESIPGLIVADTAHGYALTESEVVGRIRASGAELLLVALGNPGQELWLARNLEQTGVRLGVGVGAFFDFAAGRVRRAPGMIRRARLEWMYRLALEPRRMFRRYVLGNPEFVLRVLWAHRRVGPLGSAQDTRMLTAP